MRCPHCGLDSPTGMRFCGGCGSRLDGAPEAVAPAPAHDTAQRRHMTALFCDLVGSTPLVQQFDPEDFREVLSDYQRACVRAIERFDGYTARYVGDGIVAYFGYPRAHEDDAQRAVHAGLGIIDEIEELNAGLRDRHGISLQVRIGLHTGVVVVGEMGGDGSRSQHEIVGEMPHIAARLESMAAPGSVVISDVTHGLVDGWFETESLGEQALKGVTRPVEVHRVLRPTGAVGRLEVAGARRLTPVVGRERELELLAGAWQRAESGQGGVVHVTGEAGIGKSRLVHALIEELGERMGAVQTWQCSAHHGSTPLYPVTRYLESRPETGQEQLTALDADVSAQRITPRDARTARLRILESLLVTDPARHPLLLVVDDLHWADPTTVELLGRIVPRLPGLPVLCVLTFRPEVDPPWTRRAPVVGIELGPLAPDEVRAMATAASDRALDPEVLELVDSAADGVPLFVEEMLKMLEHTDGAETAVPPTLDGLLTERLDRLPELGDVIDMAAILGREFDRSLLTALAPSNGSDVEAALARLAAQDVIRPVRGAPLRCEFTHALLQEAAHERILRRRRRELHGRVADTLGRSFGEVAEREPEVVARHWSCAGEPAKALPFWHAAGSRALGRAAYLEAAEHFRRGLEDLDAAGPGRAEGGAQVDFPIHLAASLQAGRGYAAAGVDEAYGTARAACERAGNDALLVPVIRGQWMFHLLRAQFGTALELADEMLALAERGGSRANLAEGHLYRGLVHMYTADFDLARDHLTEAFVRYEQPERSDYIYEAQGDTGVGALAYLALVLWNLGHTEESLVRSDLSLERAEQVAGPVARAQAWGMRSILHIGRAEPAELAYWVERTLAHSTDHDLGYWRSLAALLAGWLQGRAGELELGTARVEEAVDAYLASGSRLGIPHSHLLLADLRLAAGDRRRALEVLVVAEEFIEETGERFSESELFRFKGRVLMAGESPDPEGATAAYERAVASAQRQNARMLELRAATRLAVHQGATGEAPAALDRVAALCDWFGPESELPDVARARALVASEPMAR
jgi:class 3 adenylate cyclase/predicted ATPase